MCRDVLPVRFPSLFDTVLHHKYALPHPNCRHEFIGFFEEIEDPKDVEKAIKNSVIRYDSKGNLVDVRSQSAIELYKRWQAGNRQRNDEFNEYERMKAHYEAQGQEPPYKTLAAFRRARRAQSEHYKETRKEWKSIADETNNNATTKVLPLNRENIKGQKYEKKFVYALANLPGKVAHVATVAARRILIENNRKKEETALCISLNGNIEFEQHSKGLVLNVDIAKLDKAPNDSVLIIHNHPTGQSFSDKDIEFLVNSPQVHTIMAVSPNGKVYSLRINKRKTLDIYAVSEYRRYISQGLSREQAMQEIAKNYKWEYKEI